MLGHVIIIMVLRTAVGLSSPSLLFDGTGMYPRAVQVDGALLASVVSFDGNVGVGLIFKSVDAGASFSLHAKVVDPLGARGLCCATLFVTPNGTLLWAASFAQMSRPMSIRMWSSFDSGTSWAFVSTVVTTETQLGLWEPEFFVNSKGQLSCVFSDETQQPTHSQTLMMVTSSDDGLQWSAPAPVAAAVNPQLRPGMANVRSVSAGGQFVMSYELCGVGGVFECAAHVRASHDGVDWGDATSMGTLVTSPSGAVFAHTPVLATFNATALALTAQMVMLPSGPAPESGTVVWIALAANLDSPWPLEVAAPVPVPVNLSSVCPNYSPALLTLRTNTLFEVSTIPNGTVCQAWYATSSV